LKKWIFRQVFQRHPISRACSTPIGLVHPYVCALDISSRWIPTRIVCHRMEMTVGIACVTCVRVLQVCVAASAADVFGGGKSSLSEERSHADDRLSITAALGSRCLYRTRAVCSRSRWTSTKDLCRWVCVPPPSTVPRADRDQFDSHCHNEKMWRRCGSRHRIGPHYLQETSRKRRPLFLHRISCGLAAGTGTSPLAALWAWDPSPPRKDLHTGILGVAIPPYLDGRKYDTLGVLCFMMGLVFN